MCAPPPPPRARGDLCLTTATRWMTASALVSAAPSFSIFDSARPVLCVRVRVCVCCRRWAEFVSSNNLQRRLFPRVFAIAEVREDIPKTLVVLVVQSSKRE